VTQRLESHDHGASIHTAKNRPWEINVIIEFKTEALAVKFEKYLKSGSGRAFARKHVRPSPKKKMP
jgi:hypothetical protein